jgi:hypothetical protein
LAASASGSTTEALFRLEPRQRGDGDDDRRHAGNRGPLRRLGRLTSPTSSSSAVQHRQAEADCCRCACERSAAFEREWHQRVRQHREQAAGGDSCGSIAHHLTREVGPQVAECRGDSAGERDEEPEPAELPRAPAARREIGAEGAIACGMFETKTAATKTRLIGMPIPTGCRGSRTRGRRPRPSPRRCPSRHPLRPSRIVSRRMRRRGERRRRRRAPTHRSARDRCAPLPREAGRRRLRRSSLRLRTRREFR